MSVTQAAILGIVQGLTEFLPISSTAHLLLVQHWFGIQDDMMIFDIALHWGTLVAVFIYFAREIGQTVIHTVLFLIRRPRGAAAREEFLNHYPYALTGGLILLATLVTGFVGVFCLEFFKFLIQSIFAVGVTWLMMGVLLILSARIKNLERERTLAEMHHRDAFFIGLAQGISLMPGISRAGATILMGLKCGLTPRDSARYSFLLSIPAILGIGLLKLEEGIQFFRMRPEIYGTGFAAAMIVGILAIKVLFQVLERGKYHYFGYYCLAAGIFAMASPFLKP